MRIIFSFLLLIGYSFWRLPASIFAAGEFETNYNIRYQVQPSGRIGVSQDIALTNKLSNVYATQYSLTIRGGLIENISSTDEQGPLKTEVAQRNEETTISFDFNQQVVGTGKTLKFNLRYDALNLAQKKGQVWEINIPKLSEQTSPDNYTLMLAVPASFGNPAYIKPSPAQSSREEGLNLYRFTKEQLLSSGINAVFGEFQFFQFQLSYHLENPDSSYGEAEIALPPDTAFQQISYQKINPPPLNVRVDNDGNWLAKYRLKPNEKINITASGIAKIFAQPQDNYLTPTWENLAKNLLPQKYWEAEDPLIRKKALALKTPKAIYDFVINNLDYDFDRVKDKVERFGARQALDRPKQAICMEFTDLFIALARAAGIPARELNGFAYTTNEKLRPLSLVSDVLHSWPEYFDAQKGVWIPIDPTWGETTGGVDYFSKPDLNHFAFVIHGENSQEPYPAGSYKTSGASSKDVEVSFGEYESNLAPEIRVSFDVPKKIFWGVKNAGSITIKNTGTSALYHSNFKIDGQGIVIKSNQPLDSKLSVLPPFASKEIQIGLETPHLLSSYLGKIRVLINGHEFNQTIEVNFLPVVLLVGGIIVIALLISGLILTKSRLYARK